jgi:hypothetical protein
VVLEKWSSHSLYCAATYTNTHRYCNNSDTMS